tara:strand:- start:200 stop:967 length:768 start_codon:yes stop_codon:yes gene_type:complete
MSITLKRPMFRKGGEVEEGIMELATPRKNYAEDGVVRQTEDEIIKEAFDIANLSPGARALAEASMKLGQRGRISNRDLLTNVLIQGGLRGLSTAGKGSTLANLASAFEAPVGRALQQRTLGKQLGISGAMKGLELGAKTDILEKRLKAQQPRQLRDTLVEKQYGDLLVSAKDNRSVSKFLRDNKQAVQRAIKAGVEIPVGVPKEAIDQVNLKISDQFLRANNNRFIVNPFTNRVNKVKQGKLIQVDQETFEEIGD